MRQRRLPILLCTAAAAMAVGVYLNALDNPFVWDDHRTVVQNASIRPPLDLRAIVYKDMFRPLVNLTYALNYAVGGLAVTGYHLTNIFLHAINVVLVYVLTRRTLRSWHSPASAVRGGHPRKGSGYPAAPRGENRFGGPDWAAFAASGFFAVHPMMTQAVGYISGRAEVLCAVFFLGACVAAQCWVTGGRRVWVAMLGGAWLVALASKEVAIALPLVLLAYGMFWPGIGPGERRRLGYAVTVMLGLMLGAGGYRLFTLVHVENVDRARLTGANVLVALDVIRQYTRLMAIPVGQSIFHSASLGVATGAKMVALNVLWIGSLCAVAWRSRRWEPSLGFGISWFLLLLLPSSSLLVLDIGEPMAEQRTYLAACGFAIAVGGAYARVAGARRLTGSARVVPAALIACLVLLAGLTIERNRLWRDPVALWSEAVEREPKVWVPYVGLGDVLRERGEYARAADVYREAVRLRPEEPAIYLPLATSLLMSGREDEADRYFEQAERLSPGGVEAPVGRAMAARIAGRLDEARDRLESVAKAYAGEVLPRRLLAEMYEQDYGDRASALRACLEVKALAPATPGVDECVRRNQQPGGNDR